MALIPSLVRTERSELLDQPDSVTADLPANLADIRRLNAWFGGTSLAIRGVRPFLQGAERVTLLDVATGSGDVPDAISRAAATWGVRVHAVGLDISSEILEVAGTVVQNERVSFSQGDARSLPYADESFDVVICCLALHHFAPNEALTVLSEMWRVARRGIVVTDLRRSRLGYVGAWLSTRTVARNRLTRHDGPLSVLRAYTPGELAALAARAGISGATVLPAPFFRLLLAAAKGE